MRLDAAPFSLENWSQKWGKHAVWITVALWTGFTFVGYFTPMRELGLELLQTRMGPWEMVLCFLRFATPMATLVSCANRCGKVHVPYARFQSAMFDKRHADRVTTLVAASHAVRARSADTRPKRLGECVDCTLCVQVCPDRHRHPQRPAVRMHWLRCLRRRVRHRHGQGRVPRGLVRYTTQHGMARGWGRAEILRHALRPRVLLYTGLLAAVCIMLASLMLRNTFKVDVVRDRARWHA